MKILFVSLGCDKNRVDTEVMLGMLQNRGFSFTDDEEEAKFHTKNGILFVYFLPEDKNQRLFLIIITYFLCYF